VTKGWSGEAANGLAHGSADMPELAVIPPDAVGASHVGRAAGVELRSRAAKDCSSSILACKRAVESGVYKHKRITQSLFRWLDHPRCRVT
jgi:hypothetical protein